MDVRLPDGTIIRNVPEGTTREQLTAKLQANGYDVSKLSPAPAKAEEKPKQTLWDVVKREAKPDIFNSGEAAYSLGGKVTDATGSPMLGYLANVGVQAIPTVIGAAMGGPASSVMEAGARRSMQSALKPTIEQLRKGEASKAITTMLEKGYSATPGGLKAMRAQIATLNDEIANAIAGSNATVDKGAVASRLGDALKKFEMQVTPGADTAAIQKAWTEFLSHPLLTGSKIPVQTAQTMKQGTYAALGNKAFGELKGAEIEAQKALARGLKEEIAAAVPGVAKLNAAESELLNAANVLERRVLMNSNNNPIGLGALADNPASFVAWMADRSPWFKSMVARAMYANRNTLPTAVGGAVGGAIGADGSQTGIWPESVLR